MNKITKGIIIGLVIGLILGAIAGYIVHNSINKSSVQGRGSFQIDEKTKSEITSFFDSNPSSSDVQNYCTTNRMYCAYYCRSINPDNGVCSQFQNISRAGMGGMPQKG